MQHITVITATKLFQLVKWRQKSSFLEFNVPTSSSVHTKMAACSPPWSLLQRSLWPKGLLMLYSFLFKCRHTLTACTWLGSGYDWRPSFTQDTNSGGVVCAAKCSTHWLYNNRQSEAKASQAHFYSRRKRKRIVNLYLLQWLNPTPLWRFPTVFWWFLLIMLVCLHLDETVRTIWEMRPGSKWIHW